MTYKFDGFRGRALYELNGLPDEVRDGPFLERVLQLLEAPWGAVRERPDASSALRHAFFGDQGQGIMTLIVDDQAETLQIIDILWAG
ncbi:hypothetical protein ACRYCC_09320 [Actinomadura scrupuli]|uniref:hypothetical protein n=1 Tax=Actinomadura scrupuli TaxID=559629 RepID=UPI003D959265